MLHFPRRKFVILDCCHRLILDEDGSSPRSKPAAFQFQVHETLFSFYHKVSVLGLALGVFLYFMGKLRVSISKFYLSSYYYYYYYFQHFLPLMLLVC